MTSAAHETGFRVVEGIPAELLAELRTNYARLGAAQANYFSSNVHCDRTTASAVDKELKDLLGGVIGQLIDHDVEPFIGAFISKAAHSGPRVDYHQDWTYTDEREHRVTIAWVPLLDVGLSNGALSIIEGSHRWTNGIRSDDPNSPAAAFQSQLASMATFVPVQAGRALLYDPAVVHGSAPNVSDTVRAVAAIAFKPIGSRLIHFHQPAAGPVEGFEVDSEWYSCQPYRQRPSGFDKVKPWAAPVDPADLARHAPIEPASAGLSEAPIHTIWPPTDRRGRPDPKALPVLRNPKDDQRLRRDGFVRLSLLDTNKVSALKASFARLYGQHGEGYQVDFDLPEAPYRRATHAALEQAVGEQVTTLFDDHRVFVGAFMCLWPGAGPEGLRQDWMFVDERLGESTYVVWIALDDVTGHGGQPRVLRGSHLLDGSPRGTGLRPPWFRHEALIDDRLESVPVPAGDCIVMHSALVRNSHPNHTQTPRLVAAIGVCRSRARLVHFRRRDDHRVDRFDVDDDLFLTMTPADLESSPPRLPISETAKIPDTDLEEQQLKATLDQTMLYRGSSASGQLGRHLSRTLRSGLKW